MAFLILMPLALLVVAIWNLLFSSDPIAFRIIVFVIFALLNFVMAKIYQKLRMDYGLQNMYYELVLNQTSLLCKNKINQVEIKISDINKIKIGRGGFFIYYGDDKNIVIPDLFNNSGKPFFEQLKSLKPGLDISYNFPFSAIKY